MRLPVIVERSARTMVQERYNVDWVVENGVGLSVADFRDLSAAVSRLLAPHFYRACLDRIDRLGNRAVFEIPGILRRIHDESRPIRNQAEMFHPELTGSL